MIDILLFVLPFILALYCRYFVTSNDTSSAKNSFCEKRMKSSGEQMSAVAAEPRERAFHTCHASSQHQSAGKYAFARIRG